MMSDQEFDPAELVEVLASIDAMQVRMAHDMLESNGIESFIFDEESSRMLGSTAAIPARLMVHADVRDDALKLLGELGFEGPQS
jgi:Putative prokaryotic signal transducing protein